MTNFKRLAAIAADPDFQAFIASDKERLTRKVMSAATLSEDREKALAEFHMLSRLMARLADAEHEAKKDTDA